MKNKLKLSALIAGLVFSGFSIANSTEEATTYSEAQVKFIHAYGYLRTAELAKQHYESKESTPLTEEDIPNNLAEVKELISEFDNCRKEFDNRTLEERPEIATNHCIRRILRNRYSSLT